MPGTPTPKMQLATIDASTDFVNDYPAAHNDAVGKIDALAAQAISTDPRPAPGKFGRFHLSAAGLLSFDNGVNWIELSSASAAAAGATFIGMLALDAGQGDLTTADQEWLRADGRLINRLTYAAYFTRVGHAHNGGVDPGGSMVRLPDYRGRTPVGADDMGTGAAGRLPNSNRARGQNGGTEQHANSIGSDGSHVHATADHGHTTNLAVSSLGTSWSQGASMKTLIDPNGNTLTNFKPNTGGIVGGPPNTGAGGTHAHGGATGAASSMQPYGCDNVLVRVR